MFDSAFVSLIMSSFFFAVRADVVLVQIFDLPPFYLLIFTLSSFVFITLTFGIFSHALFMSYRAL